MIGQSRLGLEKMRNVTFLVSVSSRSRKIILQNSRSRLGLEILTKPGLGLVSVSKNVVSSNSDAFLFLYFHTKSIRHFYWIHSSKAAKAPSV